MAEISEQKTYYRKLNKPKTRSLEKNKCQINILAS